MNLEREACLGIGLMHRRIRPKVKRIIRSALNTKEKCDG